jgi:small subunit ribosomal protein S7
MSRKARHPRREVQPDPMFGDVLISKVINNFTRHGKKSIAEKAIYTALELINTKSDEEPIKIFRRAIDNLKPMVEVRSRRVGGATYQVPTEVRAERAESLAIRWLVTGVRTRTEKSVSDRIANELMDAFNGRGIAFKKKEDAHKMAEANKAFSHFRW